MTDPSHRIEVFHQLHASGCFVIPNPWDVGSARLLAGLGFPALATTSSGFAWSQGKPDNHVTLEQAVRKMTGMSATRLGLKDQGCLAAGCAANVAVFSAEKVRDVGTFADPHHYPEGIPFVVVNGTVVVDGGRFTAARPGRVLRKVSP